MHVIVEAGALFFATGPRFSAGDEGEDFVEGLESFSDGVCVGIGAESFAEGFSGIAGVEDAGEGFFGDGDVGIGFIVPHADVVGGAVFFDEVAFEDEGFEFGVDDDGFNVANFADEAFDAGSVLGGFAEVGANSRTKIDGFSDVENGFVFVAVDIATGGGGDIFELVFDVGVG